MRAVHRIHAEAAWRVNAAVYLTWQQDRQTANARVYPITLV